MLKKKRSLESSLESATKELVEFKDALPNLYSLYARPGYELKLPTPSVGANDLCCSSTVKQLITYLYGAVMLWGSRYYLVSDCEMDCASCSY